MTNDLTDNHREVCPLRIAVVSTHFPPRAGGTSVMAGTLARHHAAAGHDVLAITLAYQRAPAEETADGIRVIRLPARALPDNTIVSNFDLAFALRWGNGQRVDRILNTFRPDIVHQHGQFYLTWLAGLWARRHQVPTVLTPHTRLRTPMRLLNVALCGFDMLVVRPILAYLRPARVVAIDTMFRKYLIQRYRVRDEQIVSVSAGVELDRFQGVDVSAARACLARRWGLGAGPVIASLGHVVPGRDRLALIEALPEVLARHPDTRVLVIGGVYDHRFRRRADDLGVADAIVCAGTVPPDEIPGLLAAADMEVHDLRGLGIGVATLEAMAAGTPTVLGERSDYFPQATLRDGEHTLLIEPADHTALARAINHLIDNPARAERIGECGQQWVRDHADMSSISAQYLALMDDLTRNGRHTAR
ncbi:glycosyltransferase family 4 protein [Amycolatopsis arida]|uniref:glycosyltransferase family 4 protein n=1 Tax=Amycolatopsis arida TaxID=587909 RepID=UPI001416F3AD|nr:glycosyltransferase family 4 protein [Amycolatopsis arida]